MLAFETEAEGSAIDIAELTSSGIVNKDDLTTATSSSENNQLVLLKDSEGTKNQTDVEEKEGVTKSISDNSYDERTEPTVTTTPISSPSAKSTKPLDDAVKSPPVSRKPVVLSPLLRFPLRIGITWKKGEKLEAMDFSKTWYPSRIVEIDEDEKSVLIHFDGWNSRYDEWVPMDSDKLRPQTRHSERKDKKSKSFPQPIYRPGEAVLARWTDCKKYPAKISRLMPDGTFEVVFYDGVTRNVQPINVQPLPDQLKQAAESIHVPSSSSLLASAGSPSTHKSSFKNLKLDLPEDVMNKTKILTSNAPTKKLPGTEKKNRHMEKSIKKSLAHISGSYIKKSPLKAHRLKGLQGSSKKKFKKKEDSSSSNQTPSSSGTSTPCLSTCSSSTSLSSSSAPDTSASTLPAASVVSTSSTGDLKMVLKIDHTSTLSTEEPQVEDSTSLISTLPTGVKRVKKRANTEPSLSPRKKKKKKKKLKDAGLIPKSQKVPKQRRRLYSEDLGATSSRSLAGSGSSIIPGTPPSSAVTGAPPSSSPAGFAPQLHYFVPSKAFIVEEDHNPFKCPFDGCSKEFRKENLLTSHIKHYHDNLVNASTVSSSSSIMAAGMGTNISALSSPSVSTAGQQPSAMSSSSLSSVPGQFSPTAMVSPQQTPLLSPVSSQTSLQLQPVVPARRRRRKTDSFCSTDSDVSVSSKGRSSSSKRQRHDSEISVTGSPDILNRDLWADVKLKAPQDVLMMEDYGETEEEDVEKDLVNCVCQIRETNGLMIQCDVCMCWQHFTCVDTEGTGRPPANYVCLACERPKGVRDSCRYLYDMGWERRGELPTFPFLGETVSTKSERLKRAASDCIPLTSALTGIQALLHSTRRQIKISKEEDEPEFQLWQTDWDNWTKPEEDFTLTPPRSVEAAPSPAPSTFMFPPASNSPPLLPQAPEGTSLPETSPGLENLPPTSIPPFSALTTSYQESFKSWLSTAKQAPQKRSSSSVKPQSETSNSSPRPTTTTTSTITTTMHFDSSIDNNSLSKHCDTLSSVTIPKETISLSSPLLLSSSSPSSSSLKQEQLEACQSDTSAHQSPGVADHLPAQSSQQQQTTDSAQPPLSLDTQPQSHHSTPPLSSPQLTPPMSSGQQHPYQSAAQQTPSSVRSCSRVSSSSSSSVPTNLTTTAAGADGRVRNNDLDLIRGNLFTLGPGGDAPAPSFSPSQQGDLNGVVENSAHELQQQHPHPIAKVEGKEFAGNGNNEDQDNDDDNGGSGEHISGRRRKSDQFGQGQAAHSYHQPLRELYIDVNSGSGGGADMMNNADDADDDNDTDTAEESVEPYRDCERNLLVHITRTHDKIESQLEEFEKQIEELEALTDQGDSNLQLSGEDVLNDVPALKKSLGKLARAMGKIQHLSMYQ